MFIKRGTRLQVNRRDDEIARIASDYTPLEISYFRALVRTVHATRDFSRTDRYNRVVDLYSLQVEQIMLAPNSSYSISSLAALREVNALTSPMSKTQAESVLASFVTKGWLLKSKLRLPSFCITANAYPFELN